MCCVLCVVVLHTCIRAHLQHTTQHRNTEHGTQNAGPVLDATVRKSMWQAGCRPPAAPRYNAPRHTHTTHDTPHTTTTHITQHTTHNTQLATHNTQHTTHITQHANTQHTNTQLTNTHMLAATVIKQSPTHAHKHMFARAHRHADTHTHHDTRGIPFHCLPFHCSRSSFNNS